MSSPLVHPLKAKFDLVQTAIITILSFGVALPLIQFLYNRSLWTDEAWLALNIIRKSSIDLMKPLDYDQVAPILFLQIEKLLSTLIPNSEYGLRLLPLISYWVSLYFFYRILRLLFPNRVVIIIGLSLFVFNTPLIYYSSEVKQYSTDVAIVTALYFFLLKIYQNEKNRFVVIAALGVVAITISNVTPIILFSMGAYLLYGYFTSNTVNFKYLLFTSSIWVVGFTLYFFYFIYHHPTRDYMLAYWAEYDGFMPTNLFGRDFYEFIFRKARVVFFSLLRFNKLGLAFPLFLLLGFYCLIKRKKTAMLFLLLAPLVVHVLLSAFALYPVEKRLIIYFAPILIIGICYGFNEVIRVVAERYEKQSIFFCLLIPIFCFATVIRNGFPERVAEIKGNLSYIKENLANTDKIYVYYYSDAAFQYYKAIGVNDISLPVIIGTSRTMKGYLKEIEELRGRCWLLVSHPHQEHEIDDGENISIKLDSLGYRRVKSFVSPSSSTYLYDFGD